MAATKSFKYERGDNGQSSLRIPRERELPADPIQRFKLRQEIIRRAGFLARMQLYRMENELEAVARACRTPRYRRILLIDMLQHYTDPHPPEISVAAKAREVVAALDAAPSPPTTSSPLPEGLRLLKGGRA